MRFDELDLSDEVLDAIDAMHFEECTPVQERAIPAALDGDDLLAVAQTGTGKTAAYLLPVLSMLSDGGYPEDAINCVVMVPTHELAQQIDRQLQGFAYFLPVSSVAIHGGTDGKEFARQQRGLKMGADIVIATPGRLLAHLQMGYVDLSRVSWFILDEADRMLDMGFYDDIMQVVKRLPAERQTLMFSATMPTKIQKLAGSILNNPSEVKIAVSRPTEKIDQSAFICHEGEKPYILRHLFKTAFSQRVIVFAASKQKVKELTRELRRDKWKAGEMHSDLDQPAREQVMHDFRAGRVDILVATDVVARGIDIDNITMVVNYDVPREAEDYVHRIGRTARAGEEGKAVTLVNERDRGKFRFIENFLGYKVRRDGVEGTSSAAAAAGGDDATSAKGGGERRAGGNRKQSHGQGSRKRNDRKQHGKRRGDKTGNPAPAGEAAGSRPEASAQAAPAAHAADKTTQRRRGRRKRPDRRPSAGEQAS